MMGRHGCLRSDLRNPLQVAGGNVELARETGDLSYLETAMQAHDRVNDLLDHLGTLAKEGKRILDPERVALAEVAEAAWGAVQTDGAELTIDGTTHFIADRRRLQQLLENPFANAVEHAGGDVTVRVGTLGQGGFYVEDNGPGIPTAERDHVFEMGYSNTSDGSGFGLAICKQIAPLTDGTSRQSAGPQVKLALRYQRSKSCDGEL